MNGYPKNSNADTLVVSHSWCLGAANRSDKYPAVNRRNFMLSATSLFALSALPTLGKTVRHGVRESDWIPFFSSHTLSHENAKPVLNLSDIKF